MASRIGSSSSSSYASSSELDVRIIIVYFGLLFSYYVFKASIAALKLPAYTFLPKTRSLMNLIGEGCSCI